MKVAALAVLAIAQTAIAAPPTIDRAHREIRFTATAQPDAMSRMFGVQGHHAIVWKDGKSSRWALFASDASDAEVRAALNTLGAKPGENLRPAAWTERENANNPEPDKRVEGPAVEVLVEWPGSHGRVPLASLLHEEGLVTPHLDFRYGGNQEYQKEFRSGCIVCLYSCPGGAIGNRNHPIRDYVRDGVVYTAIEEKLPSAGTQVTIILRLLR
ncbi:MAG TPA: YdjY domain-containing protein [Thermoanaerobaculia bacterium]|nr:YdjY domain-containing protein [Thermoanaerobaculia bacterium]